MAQNSASASTTLNGTSPKQNDIHAVIPIKLPVDLWIDPRSRGIATDVTAIWTAVDDSGAFIRYNDTSHTLIYLERGGLAVCHFHNFKNFENASSHYAATASLIHANRTLLLNNRLGVFFSLHALSAFIKLYPNLRYYLFGTYGPRATIAPNTMRVSLVFAMPDETVQATMCLICDEDDVVSNGVVSGFLGPSLLTTSRVTATRHGIRPCNIYVAQARWLQPTL